MSVQLAQPEPAKILAHWFDDLITRFRTEATKLSEDEKKRIPNTDNYLDPCQIEVFWLEEPEFQTIISSRFVDRPDKEIIVNGPFKGYEFIDKVDEILRESRWTRPLPRATPFVVRSKRDTLADVMYGVLAGQIGQITSSVLNKVDRPAPFGGQLLTKETWVWLLAGNIANTDADTRIQEILRAARTKPQPIPSPSQPEVLGRPEDVNATVGHIYPPITVGSFPEPKNLREFLHRGIHYFSMMTKAFDCKVGDERIVFMKDGLMAVTTTKKPLAVKIFNVISALILLEGVQAQAIRESETGSGTLDVSTLELRSWGIPDSTPRTVSLQDRMWQQLPLLQDSRRSISEDKLSKIVEKADKILKHPSKTEELVLWLESNTHLQDAEFSPSFLISWILVERDLMNSWRTFLGERNVRGDRKHKLANPGSWSPDSVVETMNLAGVLKETNYRALMELKSKRNSFVHEGSTITRDDALECLELATEILKHDLEGLL